MGSVVMGCYVMVPCVIGPYVAVPYFGEHMPHIG
jgi:hypothetical protein